ncbi:MAG: Rieske 2Fe-2S domain-containing protein [Bacteroidales bacterium]|nr:Rieske 2Fe-2S domain-containing protein [Bacteroidales bacterium]
MPDVFFIPITIDISSTFYIELNGIGGWANLSGGYRGIVVYRWSYDEFRAFDRACPHHPYDECAIIEVEDPPIAKCHCCGSMFLLIDGSVVQGPSKYPLKQYPTFFQYPNLQISSW